MVKQFSDYQEFNQLAEQLGILCDGKAHIVAICKLTGQPLVEVTQAWNRIVQESQGLFDQYKGLLAEEVWRDSVIVQQNLTRLLKPLGVRIEFQNNLDGVFENQGVVNLTVHIHENDGKTLGHVVCVWKQKDEFFVFDNNLDGVQSIEWTQLCGMFSSRVKLRENYVLSYDHRFPVEAIYTL